MHKSPAPWWIQLSTMKTIIAFKRAYKKEDFDSRYTTYDILPMFDRATNKIMS